jgi:methylphosphotriester-DNA--protein-cysteine methyltransferase
MLRSLMAATLISASAVLAESGAAVKGNPKSKVYHLLACKHYKAKGSTVEFKSAAEARKSGYKPCKICGKADKTEKDSKIK